MEKVTVMARRKRESGRHRAGFWNLVVSELVRFGTWSGTIEPLCVGDFEHLVLCMSRDGVERGPVGFGGGKAG